MMRSFRLYTPLILLCVSALAARADLRTDSTLGHPPLILGGPNFTIGPSFGKEVGGNLFHSFSRFNVGKGQVATFTGPASIHNVIARVTGDQPTTIDGTLGCTIPGADFYLLNPNGVMFGPDATLNVHGSFAVSSAGSLRLGAGGHFDA